MSTIIGKYELLNDVKVKRARIDAGGTTATDAGILAHYDKHGGAIRELTDKEIKDEDGNRKIITSGIAVEGGTFWDFEGKKVKVIEKKAEEKEEEKPRRGRPAKEE